MYLRVPLCLSVQNPAKFTFLATKSTSIVSLSSLLNYPWLCCHDCGVNMLYLEIRQIGTFLFLYFLFTSVWSLEIGEDLDPINRFHQYYAVHNKDICILVRFRFVIVVSENLRFPWEIIVHVAVVDYVDLILWFRCRIDPHKFLCYYGKRCNCKYYSLSILPVG